MIAIIAAMDEEVNAFRDLMTDCHLDDNGLYLGKIKNKEVVLAKSGVGKVEAAITVTRLYYLYDLSLIINIGSAGALKDNIAIGDVVIGSDIAFHDVEVHDWPKGFEQDVTCYHCDKALLAKVKEIKTDLNCHYGPMVSGDAFVCKDDQVEKILKEFPEALCVEMEAASIAKTATYFKLPFLIFRSISDITIKEGNEVDFDIFLMAASKNSASFTAKIIKELDI